MVHRKKDNRALKFKQTLVYNTNLGNTRNAVEKRVHALRPPSWNYLLDPRFQRANWRYFSRACLALHAHPRFRLLIKGIKVFWHKYYFSEWNKRQLNLWSPAPCWSRACYHGLLLQLSQTRRRLYSGHSYDFLFYSVWERMLTPPSQWRVVSMCARCFRGEQPSRGLFPLKMGGEGGTPPIFWRKSLKDEVVRRKRGSPIHWRVRKQERDFFPVFPARSAGHRVLTQGRLHSSQ